MKHAFTADIHFMLQPAYDRPGEPDSRLCDRIECFDWIVTEALAKGCATLNILGDLYNDRDAVPLRVIDAAVQCVRRAKRRGLQVNALPGNHDMDEGMGSATSIASIDGLANVIREPTVIDGIGYVPFCTTASQYAAAVKQVQRDKAEYLATHAMLDSISPSGIPLKTLCPNAFKGVLLGDVHEPKIIKKNHTRYVGSPLAQDFRDAGLEQGFVILDSTTGTQRFMVNKGSPRFHVTTGHKASLPDRRGDYVRVVSDRVTPEILQALRDGGIWVDAVSTEPGEAAKRLNVKATDAPDVLVKAYVRHVGKSDKWVKKNRDKLSRLLVDFIEGRQP